MINALYLSYDGLTDPLGQSQVLPYLLGLADADTRIFVVSCEKPLNFGRNADVVRALVADSNIVWVPLPYTKKPPVLSTLMDLWRMRARAFEIHRENPLRIVHCRSYLTALVGEALQKRGVKFIFDMRGFWADERLDLGVWKLSNPLYRMIYGFFKRKERAFVRKADQVVVLTDAARAEIERWECASAGRISVIPCCVDLDLFDPTKIDAPAREAARGRLGIAPSDKVLVHLGSTDSRYMLPELLSFFERYRRLEPNAKFLFITLSAPEAIWAEAARIGTPKERITVVAASRKDVPLYVALASSGVFFIQPSYAIKASSPTKHGEMMAMGLPVVCNTGVGDTDAILQRYQAGVIIDRFDDEARGDAAATLAKGEFSRERIMAGAREVFDLRRAIAIYRAIYARLAA